MLRSNINKFIKPSIDNLVEALKQQIDLSLEYYCSQQKRLVYPSQESISSSWEDVLKLLVIVISRNASNIDWDRLQRKYHWYVIAHFSILLYLDKNNNFDLEILITVIFSMVDLESGKSECDRSLFKETLKGVVRQIEDSSDKDAMVGNLYEIIQTRFRFNGF